MIYDFKPVPREIYVGDYAEEYELWTFGGDFVAHIGLDFNMVSYEVIQTCFGGVPERLTGLFANLPSLEFAVRRCVLNPELVNVEF